MSRCSKAVSELFSAMEIINLGKIAFAWFEDPDEFASVYPKSVTHIGSREQAKLLRVLKRPTTLQVLSLRVKKEASQEALDLVCAMRCILD